jgi:predicted DNA-binding transcriptional regulator YafY
MSVDSKTSRILRLILFLSNTFPKTKQECLEYLEIGNSSFYNYLQLLKETGFWIHQKDGQYWIENNSDEAGNILLKLFHFSEEEGYLLSCAIEQLDYPNTVTFQLKKKLQLFLNHDEVLTGYLKYSKKDMATELVRAKKNKKQVLLIDYASGNSETIKNRCIEPFEFKDDFNLVWGFDVAIEKNRQFKISRIKDIIVSNLSWQYEKRHQSLPVDVFRNTGNLDKPVSFTMGIRSKNLLTEEYPLSDKYITRVNNNQYTFECNVAKYEGPSRFVMGLPDDIEVKEGDGFIKFLEEKVINDNIK